MENKYWPCYDDFKLIEYSTIWWTQQGAVTPKKKPGVKNWLKTDWARTSRSARRLYACAL